MQGPAKANLRQYANTLRGRRGVDRGLTDEGNIRMARLESRNRSSVAPRRLRGVSAAEVDTYKDMSFAQAVAHLVDYEGRPDDVDERIGAGRITPESFRRKPRGKPSSHRTYDIDDARQRWMFRMLHNAGVRCKRR
jgi:hypothetical protein